jgi:hypothetical protein
MKFSRWIGMAGVLLLVLSCTMNWTYYPDIKQFFTAFNTYNNVYGKPGKFLIGLAGIASLFYLLPKIWAKRWNILVCCIVLAFGIRTFIVFSACYRGICPHKQIGIWLMLVATIIMMVAALFPDLKLKQDVTVNSPE